MSTKVCYPRALSSAIFYSTSTVRSTVSFRTAVTTLAATGTRKVAVVTTIRSPVVSTFLKYITRTSVYYSSTCTSVRTSLPKIGSGHSSSTVTLLPLDGIVIIALGGAWALITLACTIYLVFFSPVARRERMRKKGQGAFVQNQYRPQLQQQSLLLKPLQPQYAPVPTQDTYYPASDTHYAPSSDSPYGGVQTLESSNALTSYAGYQNYNTQPNYGVQQAPTQWQSYQPTTPSAGSNISGLGPGYLPPGAANPRSVSNPAGGAIAYSIHSTTTPSPPPPGLGPVSLSDPYRLLYNQPNDRLSAAVSLVHPTQSQDQLRMNTYSPPAGGPRDTSPPPPPPLSMYGQSQMTASQTQLAAQYRGYAEPSVGINNYGNRF